jgi:hypothetical protein
MSSRPALTGRAFFLMSACPLSTRRSSQREGASDLRFGFIEIEFARRQTPQGRGAALFTNESGGRLGAQVAIVNNFSMEFLI